MKRRSQIFAIYKTPAPLASARAAYEIGRATYSMEVLRYAAPWLEINCTSLA